MKKKMNDHIKYKFEFMREKPIIIIIIISKVGGSLEKKQECNMIFRGNIDISFISKVKLEDCRRTGERKEEIQRELRDGKNWRSI